MKTQIHAVIFIIIIGLSAMMIAQTEEEPAIKKENVAAAEKIIGLEFSEAQQDSMLDELNDNLKNYLKLRELNPDNSIPPALVFNPIPAGVKFEMGESQLRLSPAGKVVLPNNLEELAFYSVRDLAELIRTRKVTSTQLTKMYLERLKKYDPQLHCVITLTEDIALKQAKQADAEGLEVCRFAAFERYAGGNLQSLREEFLAGP